MYRISLCLCLWLLAACGSASKVTLCGGAEQPGGDPSAPELGDFSRVTNQTTLPIAGLRFPDTRILVDGLEAAALSCDRYWTADLTLTTEGDTTFTILAEASTQNRSTPVSLTITLDTTAPAALIPNPAIDGSNTANGTVTVSGDKEAGARVLLNGRPLVEANSSTTFTADVPLGDGANTLSLVQVDAAGNASTATVATVTRTSTATEVPAAIFPMHRAKLPGPDITVRWSAVTDINVNQFRVQLADSPSFNPGDIAFETTTAGTNATFTSVPNGTYHLRVGTETAGGTLSWASYRTLTVGAARFDINGDGYTDLLAGVPGDDYGGDTALQSNYGRVDLFYGGAALGVSAKETVDLTYQGTVDGGEFGIAVTSGDLNNDGYADVVAGAHQASGNALSAGAAYLFLGGASPDATVDLTLLGQNFSDGFGVEVESGFDLNADGADDFAVGAWLWDAPDGTATDTGRTYVFFGCTPFNCIPDGVPDLIMTGGEAHENLGGSVAGGFDFNGDGFDDLALSGVFADVSGLTDAGRVLVYYGGPTMDAAVDLILEGTLAGEHFGTAVAAVGDMDGDGFDELAVGAPTYAETLPSQGRVHLFAGAATPSTSAAAIILGAAANEAAGLALSGDSDVNGDGFADLALGVPFSDQGAADKSGTSTEGDTGMIEVHLGAPTINAAYDARFVGETLNDWLGFGVHMTGDADGDGVDDLLMGAPNSDQGSAIFGDVGRAWALFGERSPTPWTVASDNHHSVALITDGTFNGAVLPNDLGKDGLGGAVW
ncbi:MAG: hypothetical protein ACE5FN_03105 [Leptospirillia bacterium]